MQIRTLLIAPDVDVNAANWTFEALINMSGLQVVTVRYPATARTIDDAIERQLRADFEVVVILAHGDESGVTLDGDRLDAVSLCTLAQRVRCEVMIIESCSSVALANAVAKRSGASVLATIAAQPIHRAREVVVGFMTQLRLGLTPAAAYLKTAVYDDNSIFLQSLI